MSRLHIDNLLLLVSIDISCPSGEKDNFLSKGFKYACAFRLLDGAMLGTVSGMPSGWAASVGTTERDTIATLPTVSVPYAFSLYL